MMDVFGFAAARQQNAKRRRFEEESDPCVPAKRPLTEEAMAAFMHQLQLSSASPSAPDHLPSLPLNITAVTTCPACITTSSPSSSSSSSATTDSNLFPDDRLTRAATPLQNSCLTDQHQQRLLTPPAAVCVRQREQVGSAVTESLDLASHRASSVQPYPVRIRVTPATPPSSESGGSVSQEEDYEPMDQSLSTGHRATLEDHSSDSSDSEMPARVWIAPELKALTTNNRQFLPSPIVLDEIAKTELAVVPWVCREKYFARLISKNKDSNDSSSSDDEDEPTTADSMN